MGCALRTGVRMPLALAPTFWKPLVEAPLCLADLDAVDHFLVHGTLAPLRECGSKVRPRARVRLVRMCRLFRAHGDMDSRMRFVSISEYAARACRYAFAYAVLCRSEYARARMAICIRACGLFAYPNTIRAHVDMQ